jgi:outer membrane protein, adhesin transport system
MSHRKIGLRLLLAASAAALAASVASAPALAQSLKEAVERAIATHPEVGQVRNSRRAIDQELRAARGAYLPSIDARGAVGHEFSNNPTTRTRAGRPPIGDNGWVDMNRYEAGVSLRQLVFDGFGTDREVERNIGRAESAQWRAYDVSQAIALRAIEAYLEVQRTQRILQIAEQNARVHQEIVNRVGARSRGGRGPESDVDQARARLANAQAQVAFARNRYNDAVALYIQAIGDRPGVLTDPALAPESEVPGDSESAAAAAGERAPAVMAALADMRAAEAAVGVADSRFYPRVDIEVGYNWLYNIDGVRGANQDFTAMLVGRWNLYRGGTDTALKRAAVARLYESRDTLERARREVSQQSRVSWNALAAARERRAALQAQLASNNRVRVAYSQQFDRGRRTLLDLLDIQNEIFNTESALVTEEFTIRFGVYRVLATMGRLLDALGVQPSPEAVRGPARNLFDGMREDFRPMEPLSPYQPAAPAEPVPPPAPVQPAPPPSTVPPRRP